MDTCFFDQRFELIKHQEEICFKMLCNAGFFSGTDAIAVMDDYDVDLRNRYNNRRSADLKLNRTIYINPKQLLDNEHQQYIIKKKQLNKYFELAEQDGDFFIYLFHLFFMEEATKLTKRLHYFSPIARNKNIIIKTQVNCLSVSVNTIRKNFSKCITQIHLTPKAKEESLVHPDSDDGTLLKIDGAAVGTIVDLRRQFLMLDTEEQQLLRQSPSRR